MMRAFEYARPTSVDEAVRLLAEARGEAAVLAGGTDLISLMKQNVVTPRRVVSITAIDALRGLSVGPQGGLRIGARVTIAELIAERRVSQPYPALLQAADGIRSPQMRNVGTVVGELLQRPRCWYYRGGHGLLARWNGRSLVEEGDNRYHAILGNDGAAAFVQPSSLAPALIALDARLIITGSRGQRNVPLSRFYRIPESDTQREYDLADDEIVTAVEVPPAAGRNATYEVRHRESLDWPLAAAAALLELDGDVVRSARIVLGHVAPKPWPAPQAESVLVGKPPVARVAETAGERAVSGARALGRNDYKVRLARVAVKRAILRAAGEWVDVGRA